MNARQVQAAGVVVAAAAAALVLGLAADRAVRAARLDAVISGAADPGTSPGVTVERVRRVLAAEWSRAHPDPDAVTAVLAVARSLGQDQQVVAQVEAWAADRLTAELARQPPREALLRETYDLLLASGSPAAVAWLQRIAHAAGETATDSNALVDAGAALRAAPGRAGDDAYRALLGIRASSSRRPGMNWAALALPPLAPALAAADQAILAHLADAAHDLDGRDRVRALWVEAERAGLGDRLPPATLAALAAAMRRDAVPLAGIAVGAGCAAILAWALIVALFRVRRGPKVIDPSAETIENAEPIDLDTDAETQPRATTGPVDDPLL